MKLRFNVDILLANIYRINAIFLITCFIYFKYLLKYISYILLFKIILFKLINWSHNIYIYFFLSKSHLHHDTEWWTFRGRNRLPRKTWRCAIPSSFQRRDCTSYQIRIWMVHNWKERKSSSLKFTSIYIYNFCVSNTFNIHITKIS